MSIPQRFQTLLARIQPTEKDGKAVDRHFDAIASRLNKSFNVKEYQITGSYARGSSIHGHSDADLFVLIARSDVRWGQRQMSSHTILEQFRKDLMGRYTDPATLVRKDVHCITITFGDAKVDVVPAYFSRFAVVGGKNWPLFMIPDGYGQWKETSPSRHNAYITEADKRSGGKLKYTSQLLKHWRYSRVTPVPVSSFHIELLMAHGGHCIGMKGYAECVRDVFRDLTARGCRGLQDPVGISGVIACSRTEAQRHAALVSATYSRDHATSACIAQLYGIPEAVRQWKLVFNQGFPT